MRHRKRDNEALAAMFFLAPNLLGFILIIIGPILASLYLVFTKWDLVGAPVWNGLSNVVQLIRDDRFWYSLGNTFSFVIGTVPIGIAIALLFALLLNQEIRGVVVFRTVYFLPVISSTVAVALIWLWLYMDDFGFFAYVFRSVGIRAPHFLTSTQWAMPSVIVMSIWKGLGYNIVLLLAGLQGIPRTYYESAKIDGAGDWMRFWKITLPLLSPTIFFVLVMAIIGSFQVFDQTYILTAGGPAFATTTIVCYLYLVGFSWMKMGLASAIAWVLFLITLVFTLLQWSMQKKWVFYE